MTTPKLDFDITAAQIARLSSPDAIAAFLRELGYPTGRRQNLQPAGLSLGDTEKQVTHLEVLSEDNDKFLRIVFARLKSVTAKARGDLVRAFGKDPVTEHLLILTSDYETLEFVLIDKEKKSRQTKPGAAAEATVAARPRVFALPRRWPEQMLRIVRRLTYTMDDGLRQYDKLRSVFDAAHFSGTYFLNRALFADHFLENRLKSDPAWGSDPASAFQSVRRFLDAAPDRVRDKPLAVAKQELFDPLWSVLGFRAKAITPAAGEVHADYELAGADGTRRTVALTYPWQRWLDGPDPNDPDRPAENPGAAVVTLLERGDADWAIVTNGRHWRLYSRAAHSRSTNFYEVDLQDALAVSGLTDPNESFRYWWLFFRLEAFLPLPAAAGSEPAAKGCWLDTIAEGSRDYAREVEKELKKRVFYDVVPMLAAGFLKDRFGRLRKASKPTEEELEQIRAATLTLLYRLLFMLYAESRDLLPVREAPYYAISLKKLKEEVASVAGIALTEADTKLDAAYSKLNTELYERLADPAVSSKPAPSVGLFRAMASGHAPANVPKYNGGLFRLDKEEASDPREAEICEFLNTHRVPDYFLATAIDRLARVEDHKTFSLAFVDYKSLGVRQLGSIYEGLLEFRLVLAEEDLAVKESRVAGAAGLGEYIPLAKARTGGKKGAKKALREVRKGEPILQRDNAERKSSGSYYTPDHIVEYIVENTVGPVLKRKLEVLRPEFRKAEQTFHRHLANAKAEPRITLAHAALAPYRERRKLDPTAKPTEADWRAFALAETHREHKDLVEKLFDLKVLDPAMGSGHFLVEAVDFITDELLNFLNAFPVNPVMAAIEQTREAILQSLREQGVETDDSWGGTRRKLTDVHLLKRHVLKRCIYGVDLNPLATELAKVSLWLDAFTLGAPLNFLDHHLRTGNSLIGSSLTELEATIHDQLFKIDESHLLRAVQNVLLVARLADATASEVAKSKAGFDAARRTLSGYGVLLDILVAQHFGQEKATEVLAEGHDLDLSSHEAFRKSLNKQQRELVDAVETLAAQRRFFHWDLEFPEVFYSFTGAAEARVVRRSLGDAGFDAIIGNPPYVRQESLKADKTFFAVAYEAIFESTNDLFVFFIHREIQLLRSDAGGGPPGLMSMIVANKWLRAAYGRKLRVFLQRTAKPVAMIDFGHAPVFPDADTFPCVPVFSRRACTLRAADDIPSEEVLDASIIDRTLYDASVPVLTLAAPSVRRLRVRDLNPDAWLFDDERAQRLFERLQRSSPSLAQYVGGTTYCGILTGFNEAFYINEETRRTILVNDPGAGRYIHPVIQGRDIRRWTVTQAGVYLIAIPSSENVAAAWSQAGAKAEQTFARVHPGLYAHLHSFKQQCIPRADQGRYWWELRSCSYYDDLGKPKIVVKAISYHSEAAFDDTGAFVSKSANFIPTRDLYLLGVMNSSLMWWIMTRLLPKKKDEALAFDSTRLDTLPIAQPSREAREEIESTVSRLHDLWGSLGSDEARGDEVLIASIRREEQNLHRQVEGVFGITAEERAFLREHRALRDPESVLAERPEGLMRGRLAKEPES